MINLKDLVARGGNVVHRTVFRASRGKVFGGMGGMPVVELVTIGRKSGQKRSTMLTAPIVEGERVVLVASWGGDDRDPLWYKNLQANPEVEITMRGTHRLMTARTATPEERAELWPRITTDQKAYAGYERKTDRVIPVVICDPR